MMQQEDTLPRPIIGVGTYTMGVQPGTIEAEWFYSELDEHKTLKGLARGGTPGIIEGDYEVAYFDSSGSVKAEFELEIIRNGKTFDLYWSKNGDIQLFGVGFEHGDGMVLSYRPLD
ncbi:hypothetical protein HOL82_03215 [Candidatus Woesearchaeota archaeon]|jgi:hypothetical protein|nr:hypothetical protein [Candidatus Woesearchaeota archaeon]